MPVYRITEDHFEPLGETSFEAERLLERNDIQRRLRDRPDILEAGLYVLGVCLRKNVLNDNRLHES